MAHPGSAFATVIARNSGPKCLVLQSLPTSVPCGRLVLRRQHTLHMRSHSIQCVGLVCGHDVALGH